MSGKRYPEKFRIEAVKQVIDRGHSIYSVATRLDITTHSLYAWIKKTQKAQYTDAFRRTTDILQRAREGIRFMKENMENYRHLAKTQQLAAPLLITLKESCLICHHYSFHRT